MSHNSANQSLIEHAADSLASAQAERKAITDAIATFLPGDPLQTMLASEAVGFHLSIMDGFREINSLPMTRTETARARMVAVAQTKMVLALVRELRLARKDGLVAAEAQPMADGVRDGAGLKINLDEFETAYTRALEALQEAGPLDVGRVKAALENAVTPAADVAPARSPVVQATGSRAHRRAAMKQRGAFRKAS